MAEKTKHICPWKNMTDINEILMENNKFLSKNEEFLSKLQYFYSHNPKIFNELIKTKSPSFYLAELEQNQLLNAPKEIIDYISEDLPKTLNSVCCRIKKGSSMELFIEKHK